MDRVFKALADRSRRDLLDALRDQDGQTLGQLERCLPGLSRFGVMKHLRVLEEAGLITTQREGRSKYHFLNRVPIRLVHDRWIRAYEEPVIATLTGMKRALEAEPMSKADHVSEIYIRTTPERLWQAITDPELTRQYYYGSLIRSTWEPGARWTSESPSGELYLEGEVLEADPPTRLVQTFHVVHEAEAGADAPSRVTWVIERIGDMCRLTLTHEGMGEATVRYTEGGFSRILSGLKTLLETGTPMEAEPVA
jgi:DNA-binding transcriptional ArsR family regulator